MPQEQITDVAGNAEVEEVTGAGATDYEQTDETEIEEVEGDDFPEDYGEPVTFEDIINDPEFNKEYRKAVDREVSKALKSYQKNHNTDVEAMIESAVAEQVNNVKFQAKLNEDLKDAGVIDTTGFIAHLDMDVLREAYDPETNEIDGMAEMIVEAKKLYNHLFNQDNKKVVTGMAQAQFGGTKPQINNLRDALQQKYGK